VSVTNSGPQQAVDHERWSVLKACFLLALIPSGLFSAFWTFNSESWSSIPGRIPGGVMLALFWAAIFCLYMLPGVVAGYRGHHNRMAIIALNFLAGWTILGWLVAFVWSFTSEPTR